MTPVLFVYGTLKAPRSGMPRRLLDGAACLGAASTRGVLYDFGEYPGLVRDGIRRRRVSGELYELPNERADEMLQDLDLYEGDEFVRERAIVTQPSGSRRAAWIYVLRRPPGRSARIIKSWAGPHARGAA